MAVAKPPFIRWHILGEYIEEEGRIMWSAVRPADDEALYSDMLYLGTVDTTWLRQPYQEQVQSVAKALMESMR